MKLSFRSVRFKITLLISAVIFAALIGFGSVFASTFRSQTFDQIDQTLIREATQIAQAPPPQRQQRQRFDGFRQPQRQQGRGDFFPRAENRALRLADIRRPRWIAPNGEALNGPGDGPIEADLFERSLDGEQVLKTHVIDDQKIRVISTPVWRQNRVAAVVQMARELDEVEEMLSAQTRVLWLLIPGALVLAAISGWALAGRTLRPVKKMTRSASEISESDLASRLDEEGGDEIETLAKTFNSMLSRLETAFAEKNRAYKRLEKSYEGQKQFAADASHELRTPLARIKLAASAALSQEADKEGLKDALITAETSADAMERLIQQLLTLARADADELRLDAEPVDLSSVVATALEQSGAEGDKRVVIEGAPVSAQADHDSAVRIVVNLLENAQRHTPDDGSITVRISEEDGIATISVSDTGEGLTSDEITKVTDRFYRSDSARSRTKGGTGLGLAICSSLAKAMQGRLEIESELGRGSTFSLVLPQKPGL